jgi:hypothetical protein
MSLFARCFRRSPGGARPSSLPALTLFVPTLLALFCDAASAQVRGRIARDVLTRHVPEAVLTTPVRVISPEPDRDTAVVGNDGVAISRGEYLYFKNALAAREVAGPVGEVAVEPGKPAPEPEQPFRTTDIVLLTPDATATGVWVLRPVYKVANRMRWDSVAGVFQGALFLAIEDSVRRSESRPLPNPVRFQLITEADSVDPSELAFEHTNLPLRRVEIRARSASDSLRVHLVGEFDVNGSDIWLPVVPYLEVEPTPERIQGWGVQTTEVVVRVVGTTSDDSIDVTLRAPGAEPATTQLKIGRSGTASVTLRSAGSSQADLSATAPGFEEATATVDFVWPWVFLLAAVLGGLFGGVAAGFSERKSAEGTSLGAGALKGLFVGLLAALAWYVLGVNLIGLELGVPRQNELAVFTLAALAGYFGVPRRKAPAGKPA